MMSRKLLIAGLLTTIATIALGAAYFGFSRKENTMEQTYVENTDTPASACAVDTNAPPVDTPSPTHTENTNIPPIDAAAPEHTETATFAMG